MKKQKKVNEQAIRAAVKLRALIIFWGKPETGIKKIPAVEVLNKRGLLTAIEAANNKGPLAVVVPPRLAGHPLSSMLQRRAVIEVNL